MSLQELVKDPKLTYLQKINIVKQNIPKGTLYYPASGKEWDILFILKNIPNITEAVFADLGIFWGINEKNILASPNAIQYPIPIKDLTKKTLLAVNKTYYMEFNETENKGEYDVNITDRNIKIKLYTIAGDVLKIDPSNFTNHKKPSYIYIHRPGGNGLLPQNPRFFSQIISTLKTNGVIEYIDMNIIEPLNFFTDNYEDLGIDRIKLNANHIFYQKLKEKDKKEIEKILRLDGLVLFFINKIKILSRKIEEKHINLSAKYALSKIRYNKPQTEEEIFKNNPIYYHILGLLRCKRVIANLFDENDSKKYQNKLKSEIKNTALFKYLDFDNDTWKNPKSNHDSNDYNIFFMEIIKQDVWSSYESREFQRIERDYPFIIYKNQVKKYIQNKPILKEIMNLNKSHNLNNINQ